MQDITPPDSKHEHTEKERLRFALAAAEIGTWDLDPLRNEVTWDERCRELFGFAPGEKVAYEQVLKYIHPDDVATVNEKVQQALDPSTEGQYEVRYRTIGVADGKLRWVLSKGKAYFDTAGIAYRFAGIAQDITSSILEREKTDASEKIAQVALDNSNSGYFRVSLTSDEIEYSPGYARILTGDARTDLKRTDFINHVHPDDRDTRTKAFEAATQTGKLDYEARIIWNDGSIHWMRAKGTYLHDTAGKPYVLTGTIHDTTAEHLHREAVKEAEDLLTSAFSNASVGMAFTDLQGRFLRVNTAFTHLLGHSEEAFYKSNYQELIYPEDKEENLVLLEELVSGKRHYFNLVKRYLHKAGTPVWVQINVTRITGSTDKEGRIMIMARDISQEVENEQALAAGEALFKNVTNSAPTGLWLSDEQGGLTYLNKTLTEWTGMPYESLLGTGWTTAIIEEDRQHSAESFLNAVTAREHYDVLFRIRKGDNSIVWCRAAGDPYYREDGSYAGYAGFCMDIEELVAGREALQKSEVKFRTLVEEAPVATCLFVGREMRIEIANEIMINYWGKDRSVIGLPLAQAVPELVNQPFLQILDEVYTTGQTYTVSAAPAELEIDGVRSVYYFDFTYKPLFNAAGEVYAIMDMAADVTGQVMARKKLEESELFSRSIIYNSPVAKLVFSGENMVINTINENMLTLLGRDDSIIGLPFLEAIPELIHTPLMDRLRQVLATGETYHQPEEKLELVKHGQAYTGYYNYIYKALYNTGGEIYGIMVTATEVTEQVLARQKVEEAEVNLRGAIELAELGTWSLDAAGVFTWDDRIQSWYGFQGEETVYSTNYNPIHEKDRERVRAAIAHAIDPSSGGVYNQEYIAVDYRTGRERILHAQGKALFDPAGHLIKLTGSAQDVTKQRQLQLALEQQVQERTEELQAVNEELAATNEELAATNEELHESNERLIYSNQELEQYAYVASHDLQEPLRKIRIFSELLEHQTSLPQENRPLVNKISKSAERMSLLIRDLLEFSRLLKSETLIRPVDLASILAAIVNDFEFTIEEKKATVHIGQLPVIEAVSLQMNQLFYNLLSNALKFIRPDTIPLIEITARAITAEEAGKHIHKLIPGSTYYHIAFADNGIGFDVTYSEQIFEVFKRLHGREIYPGSGIGLALCRRIVANHNGYLYATSEPGNGSVFHIIIPSTQGNGPVES